MYNEILKIDIVEICIDLTKAQIIAKFEELKSVAEAFNQENRNNEVCSIFVNWIGFKLSWSNNT